MLVTGSTMDSGAIITLTLVRAPFITWALLLLLSHGGHNKLSVSKCGHQFKFCAQ